MIVLPAAFGFYQVSRTAIANSVQYVSIVIPAGSTSATASISTVDTNYAVLLWGGFNTTHTGSAAREFLPRIDLTNGTTVTAFRNTSSATHTVTAYVTVVEFVSSAINLIQKGTISLSTFAISPPDADGSNNATIQTAAISTVDLNNSVILYLGNTVTSAGFSAVGQLVGLDFYDNSTIRAQRNSINSHSTTVGYMVVEFKPEVVASIQRRAVTLTSTNSSDSDTIGSVDTSGSLLLFNGITSANSSWAESLYHIRLTDGTTVTLERNGSSSSGRTIYYHVLQFSSGVNSQQRATTSLTSATADSTITAVNTTKSSAYLCGQLTAGTVANQIFTSVRLLNSTTVRAEKNGTSTSSAVSWETVEFL